MGPRQPDERLAAAHLVEASACAQLEEKLVELRERLVRCIRRSGAGSVESFLRRIKLTHRQQCLAAFFLQGHRRDGPILATFFIGPDDARMRCHFEVPAEELHPLTEYE